MFEKNLIERARGIQRALKTELKGSHQSVLKIEDYEQPDKYIYYLKDGSPIKPKDVFSSYISGVREMNLYVHIPFCTHRCTFCCCFSVGRQPQSIVEEYVNALKKELDLLIKTSRFKNAVVRYIFLVAEPPLVLPLNNSQSLFAI
jgi:coproporphyrinogen III oxidase-like Fe-S oxidoreductase